MNYIRQEGDKAFRIVNLTVNAAPKFENFSIPNQSVTLHDEQTPKTVIEILREDGSTFVKGPDKKIQVYYTVQVPNKIYISTTMPYARLWVRHMNYPLPCYKVPPRLVEEKGTGRAYILFYGGANEVVLFGDKYFEAAYDLQRS